MSGHVHDMKPDRPVRPSVYRCSSCAFSCTPRALTTVLASVRLHHVVKAGTPEARKPWDVTS